ncbi:MAG: TonB-dependent receptor, partial [Verrucomicrobiales bacterium]
MKRELCFLIVLGQSLGAHEVPEGVLDPLVVTGKAEDLIGQVEAASAGRADRAELSERPVLRRGELLEVVPGVVVTQHAGGGKANQYFVRGFNLDHGTDFRVSLDGMPANYRTHAHGQGYADLNFIVPEFADHLDYFKGPFRGRDGDFSTAGGAEYHLAPWFEEGFLETTYGSYDYFRVVYGDSWKLGEGWLSFGAEWTQEDGPWDRGNDYGRANLFARYHVGEGDDYWNVTALWHDGSWDSSDQIAQRAWQSGLVGRYGALDDLTGGETDRFSLSTQWQRTSEAGKTHVDAWFGGYGLRLFSNFTYFLNDPVRGDQFEQNEDRLFAGLNIWHEWDWDVAGKEQRTRVGFQTRNDWIDGIGLYATERRQRVGTVREDDVFAGSYSLFAEHETRVNDWLRIGGALRGDVVYFDVDSDLGANSGTESDGILSPKFHLVLGPWEETEFYLNGGLGFHSNDARGATISVDPSDGVSAADAVDPLVRTKGAELGLRTSRIKDVTATLALWYLESDSELVFVGDGGGTEASDASERWGVEAAAYWRPRDWVSFDVEYAWAQARFVGVAPGMREVPNSVEHALSAGLVLGRELGWFGAMRLRYFAPRPLEESGSVESKSSLQLNSRLGYRWEDWEVSLDVLNLLDRDDRDIEYYYESR